MKNIYKVEIYCTQYPGVHERVTTLASTPVVAGRKALRWAKDNKVSTKGSLRVGTIEHIGGVDIL